jgi:hypothetical protein
MIGITILTSKPVTQSETEDDEYETGFDLKNTPDVDVKTMDAIILTQSCDLVQRKNGFHKRFHKRCHKRKTDNKNSRTCLI